MFDEFHYHELMDRCHVIENAIQENLCEHPAITDKQRRKLEKAQMLIGEVYQWAGRKQDAVRKLPNRSL